MAVNKKKEVYPEFKTSVPTVSTEDLLKLRLVALSRITRIRAAIGEAQQEFSDSIFWPVTHPDEINAEHMAFYDLLNPEGPVVLIQPFETPLRCLHDDFRTRSHSYITELHEAIGQAIPDSLQGRPITVKMTNSLHYEIKKHHDGHVFVWEVHDPLGAHPRRRNLS